MELICMFKKTGWLLSFVALVCTSAIAQTGVGQIQGTLTDSTGGVLPNARVSLSHVQTANKFDSTTSGAGVFLFPSLQPGDYKLTVSATGLQTWEGTVLLRAGQEAVVDVSLKVAGTTEQINVVGNVTPLVTTT